MSAQPVEIRFPLLSGPRWCAEFSMEDDTTTFLQLRVCLLVLSFFTSNLTLNFPFYPAFIFQISCIVQPRTTNNKRVSAHKLCLRREKFSSPSDTIEACSPPQSGNIAPQARKLTLGPPCGAGRAGRHPSAKPRYNLHPPLYSYHKVRYSHVTG